MYYLFLAGAIVGSIGLLWWIFSAMRQGKLWVALVLLLPGLGLLMFAYRHFRYARIPFLLTIIGGGMVGGAVYSVGPDRLLEELQGSRDQLMSSYQAFLDARNAPPEPEIVVEPEQEKPAEAPAKPTRPVIKDDPLMKNYEAQIGETYKDIGLSQLGEYPSRMMRITLTDGSQRELRFIGRNGDQATFSKAISGGAVTVKYDLAEIAKAELVNR